MARTLRHAAQHWRAFFVQVLLLSVLSLHSLGLLSKHDTATEQDACAACQVVNHQAALDLPDPGCGCLLPVLLFLFLVVARHRDELPGAPLFARARSRAPPSFFS
ncbi:MAG TPA: hypothetical protein VMH32_14510 [Burkholderiales bacterium]|nr:hypothetical protein [Burkholderiales bacterium]